jgi:hypothetical protein
MTALRLQQFNSFSMHVGLAFLQEKADNVQGYAGASLYLGMRASC